MLALAVTGALAQTPASVDKAEQFGEAARKGDVAAVRKLLDEGIDVNTRFRYGVTALSYASDRGHLDVVTLLLERGADVNARDTFYNATPLSWAVAPATGRKPQHPEIVALLLKHGAQGKGDALISAIATFDMATIKIILDSGGLPALALSDALALATKTKHREVVALLERAGAKPGVEFKMAPGRLASFAGRYRGAGLDEVVFTLSDGRLIGGPAGQKLTLIPRSETTFGAVDHPGLVIEFIVKDGKAIAFSFSQGGGINATYTRVEGR
jgi:hypothetical protein